MKFKIKFFDEFTNENLGNFFKNTNLDLKSKIEEWCNKMGIKNYEIVKDEKYEYIINVNGNVFINKKNLTRIPYKFGEVKGDFDCSYNNLESLENSPDYVYGYFDCSHNPNLKSLNSAPQKVDGLFFSCNNCNLYSLKGAPQKVKIFNCSYNPNLKNLIGGPKETIEYHCNNCGLESLEGAPQKAINFYCNNNPRKFSEKEIEKYIKNILVIDV